MKDYKNLKVKYDLTLSFSKDEIDHLEYIYDIICEVRETEISFSEFVKQLIFDYIDEIEDCLEDEDRE